MNLNDEKIKAKAAAYARATTSARCSRMGQCQDCTVRYCNYRSRYEAYLQGYKRAVADLGCTDTKRFSHKPLTTDVQP